MAVHFDKTYQNPFLGRTELRYRIACGQLGGVVTTNTKFVDCGNCKRTRAFKCGEREEARGNQVREDH